MKTIFFILFLTSLLVISGCGGPGEYDEFAKCLTEKDAKMYGTEWCSHCKEQKKEFGKSFVYVHYVDCDKQKSTCQEAGITGYPTWIINEKHYSGKQDLFRLAGLTGCKLSADEIN